jgi:D-sedoheptulose 7-phosphate isomerase
MTTADDRARLVDRTLAETIATHEQVRRSGAADIVRAADLIAQALRAGRTILSCGNGGSAADAQHFAAELVGRFVRERQAWPAVSLTTDTSILTAVANDYSYEQVFARQVEAHGRPGAVLLALSTSGNSRNVIAAVEAARARGMATIALTGQDGGAVGRAADIHLNVPCGAAARVQEAHCTILHILCELVERELTGD